MVSGLALWLYYDTSWRKEYHNLQGCFLGSFHNERRICRCRYDELAFQDAAHTVCQGHNLRVMGGHHQGFAGVAR
jgi:hypothetical protein